MRYIHSRLRGLNPRAVSSSRTLSRSSWHIWHFSLSLPLSLSLFLSLCDYVFDISERSNGEKIMASACATLNYACESAAYPASQVKELPLFFFSRETRSAIPNVGYRLWLSSDHHFSLAAAHGRCGREDKDDRGWLSRLLDVIPTKYRPRLIRLNLCAPLS